MFQLPLIPVKYVRKPLLGKPLGRISCLKQIANLRVDFFLSHFATLYQGGIICQRHISRQDGATGTENSKFKYNIFLHQIGFGKRN